MAVLCSRQTNNVHPVCFSDQDETVSDQRHTVPVSDEELRQRRLQHLESNFHKVSEGS